MAKSKLFKKKKEGKVPEELPDLAIDDLKKDLEEAVSGEPVPAPVEENSKKEIPVPEGETLPEDQNVDPAPAEEVPPEEALTEETSAGERVSSEEVEEIATEETSEETPIEEPPTAERAPSEEDYPLDSKKSFFNRLSKEFEQEGIDIENLNKWYKEKFPKGDALEDMKEYWEDKKDELIIESIGNEYKTKIKESMKNLQKLESEWQKIYFNLVTKEEEMKNQEKTLRATIKEFTQVIKRRSEDKKEDSKKEKASEKGQKTKIKKHKKK